MFDIDKAIDAFRRGALDIDCKHMVLIQHKEGGERFEGQGYIRQVDDGALIFKIYVAKHHATPVGYCSAEVLEGSIGTRRSTISKLIDIVSSGDKAKEPAPIGSMFLRGWASRRTCQQTL
jgi:hypothetical protein